MRRIDPRNFRRATRTTAREVNRQIALTLVREHQPISRAELARRMTVSRGTITELVGDLLAEGLVVESAKGDSAAGARGRRPTMLHVRTRDRLVVAIDVRFSRTWIMLADFAGHEVALESFPTVRDPALLVSELAGHVRTLLATNGGAGACEGVGLVVPGMVDHDTGVVLNSPQLGWRDVAVRDDLSAALGLPVAIENASLACALAQMWGRAGAAGATGDFVYVTVGDGVGAGIVVNGQLVRGRSHTAGEFGHIPLHLDGPPCLCGRRGCWEVYASNVATALRYRGEPFSPDAARALLHDASVTIDALVARAAMGEPRAVTALEETGHWLGVGLAGIVNALNPARIFVGGEITGAWDRVAPPMRRAIEARALTTLAGATPVIPEQVGGHPRLRGAAALVTSSEFAAPMVG